MAKKKPLIQINLFKKKRKIVKQPNNQSTPILLTKESFREFAKYHFREMTRNQSLSCLAVFDMDSIKIKSGGYPNAETTIGPKDSSPTIYFFLENMYKAYLSTKTQTVYLTDETIKDLKIYLERIISGELFNLGMPDKPYAN